MSDRAPTNPFSFGAIALDEAFTDRIDEVRELRADAANGQDVVIFAPRRYGKTSLVRRVGEQLSADEVLVADDDAHQGEVRRQARRRHP
jgi:AAA+ ATPase superfamily predicted ATPase